MLLCCFYRHTEQETEIIRDSTSKEQFSTSPLQFKFTFFNTHWKGFEFLVPVLQTISSSSSLAALKDRLFTSNVYTHISKRLHQEWKHYLACASQAIHRSGNWLNVSSQLYHQTWKYLLQTTSVSVSLFPQYSEILVKKVCQVSILISFLSCF